MIVLASATTDTSSRTWSAVRFQPNKYRIAIENLERQGFSAYCPVVRRSVGRAGRTQQVLRPLFPGYLFVHIAAGPRRWQTILSTIGVRDLVRTGDRPALIDNRLIAALKTRERDGVIVVPAERFSIGQTVRVEGNAFDGFVGTVVALDDEKARVTLLVEFLNRAVRVDVDAATVLVP